MSNKINLGFVPLTDSAPLIVAQELGFFRQFEIDVTLSPQNSWSTLRDKLQTGLIDAAQLLAPIPLASSLGLGGLKKQITVPLVLSQNGNAITLSNTLYNDIMLGNKLNKLVFPMPSNLLSCVVKNRVESDQKRLRFATVFPYSCHQYQLFDWLKSANLENDIDVITIPPADMSSSLESGFIDGFCVGGPWNAKSVREGTGVTVIASYNIWQDRAEKVLGVTQAYYQNAPELTAKLCASLILACEWLQYLPNRFEAAKLMSDSGYLNEPIDVIAPSLLGSCLTHKNESPQNVINYNRFYQDHPAVVNRPNIEMQEWLLQKMIENQQLAESALDAEDIAFTMANITNQKCFDDAVILDNHLK
jgi:NitT/TauT family transport system ATP-binding protein/nitrate/nitrite transport system substrate-binding protein